MDFIVSILPQVADVASGCTVPNVCYNDYMSKTDVAITDIPLPSPPARRPRKSKKAESRDQGVESAAIAYVQMKNGDYKYGENVRRQWDEEGNPEVNKKELMRRAGYAPGSLDHFDAYLGTQDRFWELVELHEMRRTDPMFRKEQESHVWAVIGSEALKNLYERIFYAPHSLSTEQHLKILKLILDAGISMNKLGSKEQSKSKGLLDGIEDEGKRASLLKGYANSLRSELEDVEALTKAHAAADKE